MSNAPDVADALRDALGVAVRSLGGTQDLEVVFSDGSQGAVGGQLRLPPISASPSPAETSLARGRGDAAGLRLRHHAPTVHQRYRPSGAAPAAIFDALEQARVEALGARAMPGVARNLDAALIDEVRKLPLEAAGRSERAALATRLTLRRLALGTELPEGLARALQDCPDVMSEPFQRLPDSLADQRRFARLARLAIAELGYAGEMGQDPDRPEDPPEDEDSADEAPTEPGEDKDDGPNPADLLPDSADSETSEPADSRMDAEEAPAAEPEHTEDGNRQRRLAYAGDNAAEREYRVFTREFDREVNAGDLCSAEERDRCHALLEAKTAPLRGIVGRLANRLQRLLQAQQLRSWQFDLEEGALDTGRLARVVANPHCPLSYKREIDSEFRDTAVALLLDNSGSMRGSPIATAAVCTDLLARTLERCGIAVEVLGFTTSAWKGGRAREAWIKGNRIPQAPGRLNDLLHIVYKPADAPLRRTRRNLGLMLREGLLKENIDGEALEWAHARLLRRPEQRRILLVISDGAPIDDSTLAVNPPGFLERHLKSAIDRIEREAATELRAIGIGHDVTRHYRRAVTINSADQLADALTDQLTQLFGPEPRRRRAVSASGASGFGSGRAGSAGGRSPAEPRAAAR